MKKLTAFLTAALMIFVLAACSGNNADTAPETSKSEGTADKSNTESDKSSFGSSQTDNGDDPSKNGSPDAVKVLVAYFSATNTTKGVAKTIADSLGADLYEITPEQPYTSEDLNYNNDSSRSTIEMNDANARPAISGSVENMEQYDIVFIGYPIWWSEAPRILSTFVESYSFSGKTIVPFCTSGGSGVGSSAKNLERLTDGAVWLPGIRLDGGESSDSVAKWLNGLGLDITVR